MLGRGSTVNTSCRPNVLNSDRTVLLPLGQTVLRHRQAQDHQLNDDGGHQVVLVIPDIGDHRATNETIQQRHTCVKGTMDASQEQDSVQVDPVPQGEHHTSGEVSPGGVVGADQSISVSVSQPGADASSPGTNLSHLGPGTTLDPEAEIFHVRDRALVHNGKLAADLDSDWREVQHVQAGGTGNSESPLGSVWSEGGPASMSGAEHNHSTSVFQAEPILPFQLEEDISDVLGLAPKQVMKVNRLKDLVVQVPGGQFIDKVLPSPEHHLPTHGRFTPDYHIALHNIVSAPGIKANGTSYPSFTPNHLGARIKLPHVQLKIERWRYHLVGYQDVELSQFLEYGFPLGLSSQPDLGSCQRNHGSAYMWYGHVDKFICTEVTEGGLTGPFQQSPWWNTITSPLMTAHKKVKLRRTVYDATFGDKSLNNSTPTDSYLGLPCKYSFPKIEDYKRMILVSGPSAWMWKRDLSRFYLQLPLDPIEYSRVGIIWRGLFFFFLGLAFGLRHSGLQGQKVTDAVAWILRRLGIEDSYLSRPYQVCNYVDDLGGVEATKARATAAFNKLGLLLADLGLSESLKKAEAPTRRITYLGVEFDSEQMTMSVPPDKITEIKSEIGKWARRTTITKKELQSLLGKLFWVAKVVKYARAFMGRLLGQLRSMANDKDNKKVRLLEESKKDILWWHTYLDTFNGISMIVNDEPIPLSFTQLLDSPHDICAGDATPTGGGAWHGKEYWCGDLPQHLQDPLIPIHVKEFLVLIVSAKTWGDTWTGRCMIIYCDNDSVCDTIEYRKPRDPTLLSLLREFLHVVVAKKFFPVVRKIGTKENALADHISRRYDSDAAEKMFETNGLHDMVKIKPRAQFYNMSANW